MNAFRIYLAQATPSRWLVSLEKFTERNHDTDNIWCSYELVKLQGLNSDQSGP